MKSKILIILAISVLLVAGVAYAAYLKSIPSHVKIVAPIQPPPPTVSLEFYEDEDCTTIATFVEWGDLEQGATVSRTELFWVKNTGEAAVTISGISTLPAEVGSLTIEFKKGPHWQSSLQLGIGEVCEVKGTLSILSNAPLGDVDFAISVEVVDEE